jgi:Tfp pilus assembly protein PilO
MPKPAKLKTVDLIIIALMVLVIAGIGYAIYHNAGQIARVGAERKSKEAELAQIRAKVANFSKLRAEVAANEAAMQQLATYIPDQEGQADFIAELSELIQGSGVQLKSCRASAEPTSFPGLPEYRVYQWDLTLTAVYPQLLKFLQTLPAEERSTLVSKINISAGEPDEDQGRRSRYVLNVQLTLDLISKTGSGTLVAQTEPKKVGP